MSGARVLFAVLAGYLADAALVAVTEQILRSSRYYLVVDLVTQCLYTVAGGYLCCRLAKSQRAALAGLIALGMVVGTVSLVTSWAAEPHGYGTALLAVYAPCVWIGWTFGQRQ